MSRHGSERVDDRGLENSERIVVKIGSALLVDENSGEVRRDWLNSLADDIAELKASRKQVLVVSSGAIAVGRHHLGLPKEPSETRRETGGRCDRPDSTGPCLSGSWHGMA